MKGATLRAQNLSFSYRGTKHLVIEDFSHEFHPGQMVALTGRSGRGKSTLLYLLGLMQRPNSGKIIVADNEVTAWPDSQRSWLRSNHFGFVFQDAALDTTRTVLDNVTETAVYRGQPREDLEAKAESLLADLGVELRSHHKPGQVSGGQAQRVATARALLADPHFLLADEPTGNLDPQTAELITQTLRNKAQSGAVVIVATHDPRFVEACDTRVEL